MPAGSWICQTLVAVAARQLMEKAGDICLASQRGRCVTYWRPADARARLLIGGRSRSAKLSPAARPRLSATSAASPISSSRRWRFAVIDGTFSAGRAR
jgi:hypothetical protein